LEEDFYFIRSGSKAARTNEKDSSCLVAAGKKTNKRIRIIIGSFSLFKAGFFSLQ
jgi:hypothetical protein